jgi:hypothetical protein
LPIAPTIHPISQQESNAFKWPLAALLEPQKRNFAGFLAKSSKCRQLSGLCLQDKKLDNLLQRQMSACMAHDLKVGIINNVYDFISFTCSSCMIKTSRATSSSCSSMTA